MVHYSAAGHLDSTFGTSGIVAVPSSTQASLYAAPYLSIVNLDTLLFSTIDLSTSSQDQGDTVVGELTLAS